MAIAEIFTDRNRRPPEAVWTSIIYEWEDELCHAFNAKLRYSPPTLIMRALKPVPRLYQLTHCNNTLLTFEEQALHGWGNALNAPNVVPWVVDWYVHQGAEEMAFTRAHRRNPLVLISSRQAYQQAVDDNLPLNFQHLALSLPDQWQLQDDCLQHKIYDCAEMGRMNPILHQFLLKYAERHPHFTYVTRRLENGMNLHFTNNGRDLGDIRSRQQYMGLLRQAKVALYAAAGCETRDWRKGFGQVTPRLLEMLSQGCNVIARYQNNPDTNWWGLPKLFPSVDNYILFEQLMDKALQTPPDLHQQALWLLQHYTSQRAKQLNDLLQHFHL